MRLLLFTHRPGAVDPISLVALVILVVTLVVGTLVTSNAGRSFEFRRQASEISCGSLSEGSCTGVAGCHLSDVQSSCVGKSESDCSVTSGCNTQYNTAFVSCGGTPPCNAAARCASQNTYANCTMADCTNHRNGCVLHAATSGSCSGSSPVCSGRSQTDCNSLHQALACDWSGGSGASCAGQYISGQTCAGPGNTVSTYTGCGGNYVSGKKCEGTPYTPTPVPQHSPTPIPTPTAPTTSAIVYDTNKADCEQKYSGCSLDGNICIPDKQINAGYYCCRAGTGNGQSFNHFQQESCDAPAATPTTPALIQTADAAACTRDWNGCFFNGSCVPSGQENAHNCCINGLYTGHACSVIPTSIPTATPIPTSTPIPTTTPRPTATLTLRPTPTPRPGIPSCTLLVVQDCQTRGQSCIADGNGGHCSETTPTSKPTVTTIPLPTLITHLSLPTTAPSSPTPLLVSPTPGINQCHWGKLFASCQDYGYNERSGSCDVFGCPGGGTCCGGPLPTPLPILARICTPGATHCAETIDQHEYGKTIATISTCQSDGTTFSAATSCGGGAVCNSSRTSCVAPIVSSALPPTPQCADRDTSCRGTQAYFCVGGEWMQNIDSSNCLGHVLPSPTPTPSGCIGPNKACVSASSCDSAGRYPASGSCENRGPVSLVCCGAPKPQSSTTLQLSQIPRANGVYYYNQKQYKGPWPNGCYKTDGHGNFIEDGNGNVTPDSNNNVMGLSLCGESVVAAIATTELATPLPPDQLVQNLDTYKNASDLCHGTAISQNIAALNELGIRTQKLFEYFSFSSEVTDSQSYGKIIDQLKQLAAAGNKIMVGGVFNGVGHFALITGVDSDGNLQISDPWYGTSQNPIVGYNDYKSIKITKAYIVGEVQ